MSPRAIAFALALLFALSSAALAAPAACCAAGGPAARSLVAMDCCAAMDECPMQWKASEPAVIQAAASAPAPTIVAADPEPPDSVGSLFRVASFLGSNAPAPDRPPLYRLHAQLLI